MGGVFSLTPLLIDTVFLGVVAMRQMPTWITTVELNQQKTKFKIDTGVEVIVVTE